MLVKEELLAGDAVPFLFFDRTGFSPRLREIAAQRSGVRLITTDALAEPLGSSPTAC